MSDKQNRPGLRESIEFEKLFESHKWIDRLPFLPMEDGWRLKMLPIFCGPIVRCWIRTDKMKPEHHVSIYFDAYDLLGCVGEPYWEIYDFDDTERFLENEIDEMMAAIKKAITRLESDR